MEGADLAIGNSGQAAENGNRERDFAAPLQQSRRLPGREAAQEGLAPGSVVSRVGPPDPGMRAARRSLVVVYRQMALCES